jgi:hypothetical protein
VRNCARDEGRPFEVGNQVLISSHRKLLSSKAMVVNVAGCSDQPVAPHRAKTPGLQNLQAVEQPDCHRAGIVVTPEKIGATIAIEIAHYRKHPVERHHAKTGNLDSLKSV